MSGSIQIGSGFSSPDPNWLFRLNNPEYGPKIITNEDVSRISRDFSEDCAKWLVCNMVKRNIMPIQIPFDRWDFLPPPNPEERIG